MSRARAIEGTRRQDARGFWWVKVDDDWKYEHRVVMERMIGRPLRRGEEVRWANEDRSDNRPENLHLWALVRLWPTTEHDIDPDGTQAKSHSQEMGSRRGTDPENLHEAHKAYRRDYLRGWRARRRQSTAVG